MIKLFLNILSLFTGQNTSKSEPVRLEKKETNCSIQSVDSFCERIAPYVLFCALAIFAILLLVILVKYGASITGTEANQYYNGNWR